MVERKENRRSEGIKIFRVRYAKKKQGTRGAYKRQSEEGSGNDEAGLGHRKEKVW